MTGSPWGPYLKYVRFIVARAEMMVLSCDMSI